MPFKVERFIVNSNSNIIIRVDSFNGLRFFFCFLIFLNHLDFLKENNFSGAIFEKVFHNGGFSVLFFILLSGFCMSLGYGNQFDNISKQGYVNFLFRRIKRIYPLYIITMVIAIGFSFVINILHGGVFLCESGKVLLKILWVAPMTQCWIYTDFWDVGNSAAWFVSVIFFLYIVTPFIIHFLCKKKHVLFIVVFFSYCVVFVIILIWNIYGFNDDVLYVTPLLRIPEYVIGISCGLLVKKYILEKDFLALYKKWGGAVDTAVEIFVVMLVGVTYFFIIWKGLNFERVSDVIAIPVLMILIIVFSITNGFISLTLKKSLFYYLGSISFYIYLIHYIVINCGGQKLLLNCFGTSSFSLFLDAVILFCLTVGLSIVYDGLVKVKKGKKFLDGYKRKNY